MWTGSATEVFEMGVQFEVAMRMRGPLDAKVNAQKLLLTKQRQ